TTKKLGDLLIEAGAITPEQLDKALEVKATAAASGKGVRKRLGKILVELGFLTEDRMTRTLAVRLNVPFVELRDMTIPEAAIQHVAREVAERDILIPYSVSGRKLSVAMSDPLAFTVLDNLRFRSGMEVAAVLATESDILSAIERCYKLEEAAEDLLSL